MPLTKQKKTEVITVATKAIEGATSAVFVNFHGLSVMNANEMRRGLREKGVGYVVVKKTLLKRALKSVGIEGSLPVLEGEIAIAYSADIVEPAKTVAIFEKKFKQALSMVGGILERRYLSKEEIVALSKIPSREALLTQLVTVMNAPIQNTASALNNIMSSFVIALNQIAQSKN